MSDERHDAVSRRAYELWEQEGGEHGRHEDHWHRAAAEMDGEGDVANVTAPDGTAMPVATALDAAGAGQEPADSPGGTPAGLDDSVPSGSAAEPAGEPADSPVAATPPAAVAPAAKAPAKPRKPKTK